MPLYEYVCPICKDRFTLLLSYSVALNTLYGQQVLSDEKANSLTVPLCPSCEVHALRVLSSFAFVIK